MANGKNIVFNADNTLISVDDKGLMTIVIDTTKRLRPSRPRVDKKTGAVTPPQSVIVASTGGNRSMITFPDGQALKLGLTAYVPNKAAGEGASE